MWPFMKPVPPPAPPPAPPSVTEIFFFFKVFVRQLFDTLSPKTKASLVLLSFAVVSVSLWFIVYRAFTSINLKAGARMSRLVDSLENLFNSLLAKVSRQPAQTTPPTRASQIFAFHDNSTDLELTDIVS